jgi:alpha-1,6-mannosyltransferase
LLRSAFIPTPSYYSGDGESDTRSYLLFTGNMSKYSDWLLFAHKTPQQRSKNAFKVLGIFCVLGATLVGLSAMGSDLFATEDQWGLAVNMLLSGTITIVATILAPSIPERWGILAIIAVAVAIRVFALIEEPALSTDVYRYVWDGWVQAEGINPYRYIPIDPALSALRDTDIFPSINRADYAHTAYPPIAEMYFWITSYVGRSELSFRIVLLSCDISILGIMWSLLRQFGRPITLIVAYAWHPLAVWEIANGGHIDALMTALIMLALWLLVWAKRLWGVFFIALAGLVKPYALAALPAFWRPWEWRGPLLFIVTILLCYLPYLSVGSAVLGFMPTYVQEEGFQDGNGFWVVWLVKFIFGPVEGLRNIYILAGFAVLGALAWRASMRGNDVTPERALRDAALLLMAGLFFLSPNYPWYYLVVVPLLPLGAGPAGWVLTVLGIALHIDWPFALESRIMIWKSVINICFLIALLQPRAQIIIGRIVSMFRQAR